MPTAEPNAISHISEVVLQILVPVLIAAATWLVHKVATFFSAKTKIEIPLKQLELIDEVTLKGIHYAEERARAFAKTLGNKAPGTGKLNDATNFVMQFVEKQGWVDWTREKVERYIESKLHSERSAATLVSASATVMTPAAPTP